MQTKEYVEEEIDLKELFFVLVKKKYFILIFTFITTVLALVYVSLQTAVYEVKSVVRIGYINSSLVENQNIDAFSDALFKMLSSFELREKFSKESLKSSLRFSGDKILAEWKTIL